MPARAVDFWKPGFTTRKAGAEESGFPIQEWQFSGIVDNLDWNDYFCVIKSSGQMVTIGIKGHQELTVTQANVATNVGSGRVQVFATPMMVALIEKAAALSIEPFLEEGQSSVGTHVDVSHCSATPLGMNVWADTEVTAVDRRKVTFSVKAFDERGLIGEGTHERFIIDVGSFMAKVQEK